VPPDFAATPTCDQMIVDWPISTMVSPSSFNNFMVSPVSYEELMGLDMTNDEADKCAMVATWNLNSPRRLQVITLIGSAS